MSSDKFKSMIEIVKTSSGKSQEEFDFVLAKVTARLEALLGYSLRPSIFFTETGKALTDCDCSSIPKSDLQLPDPVRGKYKLFPYNWKDKNLLVDPFINVYSVKLVKVSGNRQFVTMQTFDKTQPNFNLGGFGNFIQNCSLSELCGCVSTCRNCVQLAVEADWLDFSDENREIPADLALLLTEMLEHYSDPYKDIKSESVDGHSWSKGDVRPPEEQEHNKIIISRYAGPFGSIIQTPTI